jgi:hypothetical protein
MRFKTGNGSDLLASGNMDKGANSPGMKVLKKSSTPPCFFCTSVLDAMIYLKCFKVLSD